MPERGGGTCQRADDLLLHMPWLWLPAGHRSDAAAVPLPWPGGLVAMRHVRTMGMVRPPVVCLGDGEDTDGWIYAWPNRSHHMPRTRSRA